MLNSCSKDVGESRAGEEGSEGGGGIISWSRSDGIGGSGGIIGRCGGMRSDGIGRGGRTIGSVGCRLGLNFVDISDRDDIRVGGGAGSGPVTRNHLIVERAIVMNVGHGCTFFK